MDSELKEHYYQVFRTTNALTKVEYADVMAIMDKIGLDDKTCSDFVDRAEAWGTDMVKQQERIMNSDMPDEQKKQLIRQLFENSEEPELPKETVDVFQRNMLEAITTAADLQLLNTL